jgi:hypothetical protein
MSRVKDIMGDYDGTTTEAIVGYARDYFKDTFGFRPETYLSGSNFETRAHYITMIMTCDEYLIKMSETARKIEGWDIYNG